MGQRTWNENPEATIDKVARLTEEVMRREIDLTDGYSNWVEIGMALANLGRPDESSSMPSAPFTRAMIGQRPTRSSQTFSERPER